MAKPKPFLHILSELTQSLTQPGRLEQIQCDECHGLGEIRVFDAETGHEFIDCPECLGSGYNTLGLIVKQILKPPAEGYGPIALRQALEEAQSNEIQREKPKDRICKT